MERLILIGLFFPQALHPRRELVDDLLEVLLRRKLSGHVVRRDADRLTDGLKSELQDGTAPALAQEYSDARVLDRRSHRAVHCRMECPAAFVLESMRQTG